MNPDKCPHCWAGKSYDGDWFDCMTYEGQGQTNLCRERAAHAATKRELAQARAEFGIADDQRRDEASRAKIAEERAEKAEARVAELVGLLKSFKQIFRRQMVGDDPLGAKCVFCSYNGPGYWQPGTHSKSCPWHSVGGMDERRKKLSCLTLGQAMPAQKGGQS